MKKTLPPPQLNRYTKGRKKMDTKGIIIAIYNMMHDQRKSKRHIHLSPKQRWKNLFQAY